MSKYRQAIPNLIATEQQATAIFNSDALVFLFGDDHYSTIGHQALADLMPALAKAGVTALALELPPEMNQFLDKLPARINQQKLDAGAVKKLIDKENTRAGFYVPVGGEQRVADWAGIIVAAAHKGISIAGIDIRAGNPDYDRKIKALNKLRSQSAKVDKVVGLYSDLSVTLDNKIAEAAKAVLDAQQPGKKIAIMFGAVHSCGAERQKRLINYLDDLGVKATGVMLDPLDPAVANACNSPPALQIDARRLHRDILRKRAKPPV